MTTLDRATIKEINEFKQPDVPNNAPDAIEAARAKAREDRNAGLRKQASELSQQYFEKSIQPGLDSFEKSTGVKVTGEETTTETKVEEEVTQSAVQPSKTDETTSDEEILDDESLAVKVTRLVNGKKVTKTVGEWMALAEQAETAAEAATTSREAFKASKNAPATIQPAPLPPVPVVSQAPSKEELLNFVAAVQEGTREEAAEAAQKFLEAGTKATSAATAQYNESVEFAKVYNKVMAANPDISAEPVLWNAACSIDTKWHGEKKVFDDKNPFNNFEKRFQAAIDYVRDWDKTRTGQQVATVKKDELIKKKAKLKVVGSEASGKVLENETPTGPDGSKIFNNPTEYNASVERSLALKRRFNRGEITRQQYDAARRAG